MFGRWAKNSAKGLRAAIVPFWSEPDFDIPMGNVGYGSEAVVTIFALHVCNGPSSDIGDCGHSDGLAPEPVCKAARTLFNGHSPMNSMSPA
jgi:hypothetical protein